MTLEVDLVPFTGTPSRADFDCGDEDLNRWLHTQAGQNEKRGISRTVLAIPKKNSLGAWRAAGFTEIVDATILGFYSLSSALVLADELPPSKLPRHVPVIRLGRLAVNRIVQGMGFGELLLMEAITRAALASHTIGAAGLFVEAKNDRAAKFYAKYGFQAGPRDPLKLWLPLKNLQLHTR